MPFLLLWSRRLWPYATITGLIALVFLGVALTRTAHDSRALEKAHVASVASADTVQIETIRYVHDTVVARHAVTVYRAKRDTALAHLTDTVAVKDGFAACDSAIGTMDAALSAAARLISAHARYEYALKTELAASERLRIPRYSAVTRTGVEWGTLVPLTELEGTVRITKDWSIGGRVSKRWGVGEPTRRYVFASHSF